jgi:hypothetical protein
MQLQDDPPYVACKADTTIRSAELYLNDSEVERHSYEGGASTSLDRRVLLPPEMLTTIAAEYRVVGLGRGIDANDCAREALFACNQLVAGYWQGRGAVPPVDQPCQLLDADERCCPAGGS